MSLKEITLQQERKIYSVSEFTQSIRSFLESKFPFVWICGEISNFKRPSSGHYYFTLKDKSAQISAVMFRGQNQQLKFKLENGLQINALGRLTVYPPYGNYQIILEYAEPEGLGALQLAFEQLKTRLAEEGLFHQKYKKALPFIPEHISVITSPHGAVIHDIKNVLSARFIRPVQLVPVNVQGQHASNEIIFALQMINFQKKSDVIIIARGGGSLEDLQAFNNEKVARAVFASKIPVVSAIGHETDYTIVDFVADFRAPTPSAAASIIVPERRELLRKLRSTNNALIQALAKQIQYKRLSLKNLSSRLKTPKRILEDMRQKLDVTTQNIVDRMNTKITNAKAQLFQLQNRMITANPQKKVSAMKNELHWQTTALIKAIQKIHDQHRAHLKNLQGQLQALDPYAILARGYSVTRLLPDNTIVKSTDRLQPGQRLNLMFASGQVEVLIEKIKAPINRP
jgi:exodeoxyribonuclease VII large subunit